MYQNIDDSLKTAIQTTSIQLKYSRWITYESIRNDNTQLRIGDFKFSHNFIICDRLPETELLFGIDVQKKFSLSYAWDREKNCYIQKEGRFVTYTRNWTEGKCCCKILLRHNGIIPIKIKGHVIKGYMAYFIGDQDSKKGKDPNKHIMDGIHNIKGKHMIMFSFQITPTNTSPATKGNM